MGKDFGVTFLGLWWAEFHAEKEMGAKMVWLPGSAAWILWSYGFSMMAFLSMAESSRKNLHEFYMNLSHQHGGFFQNPIGLHRGFTQIYPDRNLDKFHHDRTLFSLTRRWFREIIPFYPSKSGSFFQFAQISIKNHHVHWENPLLNLLKCIDL